MEDRAVRLPHHLRQHIEAAAVGHADADVLHAERAAALDDLLQRRDHRLAAVQAEALGTGELQVAEFLEPFGFDQLVEDRALALGGERDFLVGPLDTLLDPALLSRIGDVHELDAERLAVGAAKDRKDLAQCPDFEPENLVEKDRAVHVGVGEAVGARIEVLLVVVWLEAERVEIGVEVPARAVGADQHQGVDRIARGLLDLGAGELDASALGARLQLVADRLFDLVPIAIEGRDEFAARRLRPVRPRPRGPFGALEHIGTIVLQALEECLPLGINGLGIVLVAGIEVLDIVGIAAIEERRMGEGGVGILTGHARVLLAGLGGSLVEGKTGRIQRPG